MWMQMQFPPRRHPASTHCWGFSRRQSILENMLKHVRRPLDLLLTSKAALSHLSQHKTALIHLVHLHSMTPNFAAPLTSTCYSPWLSKIPDHRPDHRWTGPGSLAMELPLLRPVGPGPPGRDMKGRRGAITGNEGGGGRGSRCLTRSLEANPELLHVSFHARPPGNPWRPGGAAIVPSAHVPDTQPAKHFVWVRLGQAAQGAEYPSRAIARPACGFLGPRGRCIIRSRHEETPKTYSTPSRHTSLNDPPSPWRWTEPLVGVPLDDGSPRYRLPWHPP
ncbi:hypothetical protein B0T11DRAFT_60086 [Plectosphaerella cucumerina]|uniref:Uncharacterized protein n=1 Tax=Plectosphaerella cucumerina TaxID=40658 RepID=A0A8K0TM71_9PEZI|nr:hypothetical protein B0T11DRAFT_60086 [Plectosphaerella cucumerina]